MIDRAGKALILARNGLQASTPPTDLFVNMQTNLQARAVLGIVANRLHQGFAALNTFPFGSGEAKKQAADLLNRNNAYAQKVYKSISANNDPIDQQTRKEVVLATKQALSSLKLVSSAEDDLNQGLLDDLVAYLQDVVSRAAHLPPGIKFPKPLIWLGLGLGGLLLVGLIMKVTRAAALGEGPDDEDDEQDTGDEDVEAAALAIVHARKPRKRRRQRVVTVS